MKKPWGRLGHPWLSIPLWGLDLWVTLAKIKIKKEEIENSNHGLSFETNINPIRLELSRRI
jgi:hypothetical protein